MDLSQAKGSVLVFEMDVIGMAEQRVGAYGIEVEQVLHVFEPAAISPVPLAPEVVLGIMNYHGRIITVVDPAPMLGIRARELDGAETRVILLRQGQRSTGNVGLRVTRVREIVPTMDLKEAAVQAGPCVSWVAQRGRLLIHILQVASLLEGLGREFGSSTVTESRQGADL